MVSGAGVKDMAHIDQVKNNIKNVLSQGGFEEIGSAIYVFLVLADRPLTARGR